MGAEVGMRLASPELLDLSEPQAFDQPMVEAPPVDGESRLDSCA